MTTKLIQMLQVGALAGVLAVAGSVSANAEIDNRKALLDLRGNPVTSTMWGTCVRINWEGVDGSCMGLFTRDELTVYFDFASSALTKEGKKKLKTVAKKLKEHEGEETVRVIGYADRIGNEKFNERLSRKRAETVRNFLSGQGVVTRKDVEVRYFGETAPATDCPDTLKRKELIKCLAPDRRVELEVDYGN